MGKADRKELALRTVVVKYECVLFARQSDAVAPWMKHASSEMIKIREYG